MYSVNNKIERTYNDIHFERANLIDTTSKSNNQQNMYAHEMDDNTISSEKILLNIQQKNVLNSLFFSKRNIDNIQKTIIFQVWKKTKQKITKQSYNDLIIIMRSIYLQNSKNLNYNIKKQIKDLNDIVVAETVPMIITNIKSHLQYLIDNSMPTRVSDRPQFVDSAGIKSGRIDGSLGF